MRRGRREEKREEERERERKEGKRERGREREIEINRNFHFKDNYILDKSKSLNAHKMLLNYEKSRISFKT